MFIEKTDKINGYYRIPSIVALKNGHLIACYECRKPTATDWGHIDIKIIKSTDGGNNWRTVKIITSGETMNNPVLTVCDEVLIFTYCKNYHDIYSMKSFDGGETFTEEKKIDVSNIDYTVIAVGPGHGIFHNGTIIMPIWFVNNIEDKLAHRPSKIATIYSTDGGDTWSVGEVIGEDLLVNPSECALAVTPDNKIIISIRNESDRKERAFAYSKNGYSNWVNLSYNSNFIDPICQGSMAYDNRYIYHINCCSQNARQNLTINVIDSNQNIIREILIDELAGYADIAIYNNELFILYEQTLPDWNFVGLNLEKIKL